MIVVCVVQSPTKISRVQPLTVPFDKRKVRMKSKYKLGEAKYTGWIEDVE